MQYLSKDFGFSTADGEKVTLQFDGGDLTLAFTDWQEHLVRVVFRDVLAFRWGQEAKSNVPRDDTTYEVTESPELSRELLLDGIRGENTYAHYKLRFNACGVLDVLCRRTPSIKERC